MKNKKLITGILLFLLGIILLNTNLISAPDPVTGSSSFSGNTGSSSFGSGTTTTTPSTTPSTNPTNFGTFSGATGSAGSFSNPYNSISGAYAIYGASSNPQFNNPSFFSGSNFISPDVYWPKFSQQDCLERNDFIMQIAPGGCSPAVVRSDLLEEQPVPVFCKVMSVKVNPLIDVSRIRSLTFSGQYPRGISGISYYPARAALRSQQNLMSSPINDNLGYVVIILNRVEKEKDMPESISGNITARIDYDAQGAFGIGNTNFYVSEISDEDWNNNYKQFGFWNGKGYIRADSIDANQVTLTVYRDSFSRQSTITLQKGQTSSDIYLSGFYCAAGMNIRVENIGAPVDSALVRINGEQMWISRGDRVVNNLCSVSILDAYAGGGRISLNCPTKNGKVDLSLASGKANLIVNGVAREYNIGDSLLSNDSRNIYLGYVGQDFRGNSFVVLVKESFSSTLNEFEDKNVYSVVESALKSEVREITDSKLQDKIKEKIKAEYKRKLTGVGLKTAQKDIEVEVLSRDKLGFGMITLGEVLTPKNRVWDLTVENEKLAKEYYDYAMKYYEELISLYPNEKVLAGTDEEGYAARGLYEAAVLSRRVGMNERALAYYDRLIREYPSSPLTQAVSNERELFLKYGDTNSRAMVNINGEPFYIELLDFKKPTIQDASAVLLIDGKEETVGLEDIKIIENKSGSDRSIQIKAIDDTSVTLSYSRTGFDVRNLYTTNTASRSEKINLGQQIDLEGVRIKLISVNLKKQAKIQIIPKAYGPRTESNFTFSIGIEKRAIQLSPEKTREMMVNLQKTMRDWSNINDKLGKVVSGLKGTCFATSAILTAKNLLSGFSGESMARKDVMTKAGGWNEYCEKLINSGENSKYTQTSYRGMTMQKCLLDHNQFISKDISIYQKQIQATNNILQGIQNGLNKTRSDLLDINGQVDSKQLEERFAQQFNNFCRSKNGEISLFDKDNKTVTIGSGGVCSWDTLTQDARRQIMTLYNTRDEIVAGGGSEVLQNIIDRELGKVTLEAKNYWEYRGALQKEEAETKKDNLRQRTTRLDGDKITMADIITINKGDLSHPAYGQFGEGNSTVVIFIPYSQSFGGKEFKAAGDVAGKKVIIQLTRQTGGDYIPTTDGKMVLTDGRAVSEEGRRSVMEYLGFMQSTRFRESNARAYQNKMLNNNELYVKYFEQAPYKGLPAEVPFDVDNGWYVELTYVLSGFGKPYDESGRPINFWICNVGPNGLIEFKKSNDDICININSQTSTNSINFGMTTSELNDLINKAQQAIAEAAKQYGRKNIVIGKNTFKSGTSFGGDEGRCSDFMSPADCSIMFNVCDPVMCPTSRCDLGGDFRVDNVVQTGVIGSLLLCLPNYKEGIVMPVCLSGVHAGIEGYLSIMNSTLQCLNESITTGKNIGICDEIKSIYLCEFFWKQATPLLNVIIPRLVESFYSQGVRGGGEYSTVQTAWQNMQASINYFKNDYALNSMLAFQARSTEEIGGEVCKSFMSVNIPGGKNFFDKLIEPDSPVQYTGWFSEESFTTATLPPTSHYKVYYHIYSGNDQGAYYVIYLKDLPESNYIYSSSIYVVDRGYINRGSQVDQARDFTAVSGYKQLCVSINGRDECGFGKVSSSYAINSLSDSYAAEQVQQNIKTQSNCVAGTASMISLINPNLQAGAEQVLEPQLYNSGIVRVCATENPGKKVLPNGQYDHTNSTYDRWKDVGYCDDQTIRCWLDTTSVKNVIKDKGLLNETLKQVDLGVLGQVDFWTEETSVNVAVSAQRTIESLNIASGTSKLQIENIISSTVKQLIELTNLGFNNKYRARGMYLLARLYSKVAEGLIQGSSIGIPPASGNPTPVSPDNPVTPVSPVTPVIPSSNDRKAWSEFYNDSDLENIQLRVYNSYLGSEEEIQILRLDFSSGEVMLVDTSVKTAVISVVNGKKVVVLQEQYNPTPNNNTNVVWTDDMLKRDVLIKIVFSSSKELYYKYSTTRGQWLSDDNDFNLNNGYVRGIESIAAKLSIEDEVIVGGFEKMPIQKTADHTEKDIVDSICEKLKK